MSGPETKFVDTSDLRIGYLEAGAPGGVPVLLLHGFPDAPVAWRAVVERLDRKRYRLIAPYLRGFGPTTVKQEELVGGQTAALGHDVLAFADALGLTRFHLVGHDWGASAAYAASLFAPERIKSLMTLASPYVMWGGKDYPPAQVHAHWYQWYFQLEPGEKVMRENAEDFCKELWRRWSPEWTFSRAEFSEAAKAWENPQFADTVLHYYRTRWGGALSLRAYAFLQSKLNTKPKPKIAVPTIYVQGGADACDLPGCSDDQGSYFSGRYERVMVQGVGHFPHRENPAAVAKMLSRQLEKTR